MKKIIIIISGIYLSLGFIMAMYFYVQDLKTFDCVNPEFGTGGFFTNPNPELCTRRGFTTQSLISIPFLTVFGVPMATVKYYYGKRNIPVNENKEIQKLENYTSEKTGISFKYPSNYIVVEAKEPSVSIVGTSTSIVLMENTPHNKQYAKTINSDFDYIVPEDQKNIDIESGQSIWFIRLVSNTSSKDILKWFKENMAGKYADSISYSQGDFMGRSSVEYKAEGLFSFEGIVFEREGFLYQFEVAYYNSPQSPRDNFYKIISTIEFQ